MTTPNSAPPGAPCWIDLTAADTRQAQSFYQRLFGWSAGEPAPEAGGYFLFRKDGMPVAGCRTSQPGSGHPGGWTVYLASPDAAHTVAVARDRGGWAVVPPAAAGGMGTTAVIADPSGASAGVWQPAALRGFEVREQPGTPTWFELHTRDYANAVAFYREVFRWRTHVVSDTPQFRLTAIGDEDRPLGGVMDASGYLPAGATPYWEVYFAVEDTGRALETIAQLGGAVLTAPQDTPHGRLAAAADPSGASFKLVGRT